MLRFMHITVVAATRSPAEKFPHLRGLHIILYNELFVETETITALPDSRASVPAQGHCAMVTQHTGTAASMPTPW